MDYSYRLKEPQEDYKQSIFEKGGITADFTIAEIEAMREHNKKALKETEAQLEIKKAEIINIDHYHPEIKELTGEALTAAWIYREAKEYEAQAPIIIQKLKDAIADNDATIIEAMKISGLQETAFPAPAEPLV